MKTFFCAAVAGFICLLSNAVAQMEILPLEDAAFKLSGGKFCLENFEDRDDFKGFSVRLLLRTDQPAPGEKISFILRDKANSLSGWRGSILRPMADDGGHTILSEVLPGRRAGICAVGAGDGMRPKRLDVIAAVKGVKTSTEPMSIKARGTDFLPHIFDIDDLYENPFSGLTPIAHNHTHIKYFSDEDVRHLPVNQSNPGALRSALQNRVAAVINSVVVIQTELLNVDTDGSIKSGRVAPCTGFFIAPRVIVSARHCVRPRNLEFDRTISRAWRRTADGKSYRDEAPDYQALKILMLGRVLPPISPFEDFVLFHVEGAIAGDETPVLLNDWLDPKAKEPYEEKPVSIVGYPINTLEFEYAGKLEREPYPMSISFGEKCVLEKARDFFTGAFRHGCDTDKANSGSPIYNRMLSEVGALHFRGYDEEKVLNRECENSSDAECFNKAVPARFIKHAIDRKLNDKKYPYKEILLTIKEAQPLLWPSEE